MTAIKIDCDILCRNYSISIFGSMVNSSVRFGCLVFSFGRPVLIYLAAQIRPYGLDSINVAKRWNVMDISVSLLLDIYVQHCQIVQFCQH